MIRISRWKVTAAVGLVVLAAVLYGVELLLFRDPRSTLFYLVQDLAFLPVSVLVVAVIVSEVVEWRERESTLRKLNMVIGAFFSELGNDLLAVLTGFDPDLESLCAAACPAEGWARQEFAAARAKLDGRRWACRAERGDLEAVAQLLGRHRDFLLVLVENPSLLEHESFTELLWAVLHVGDELAARGGSGALDQADLDHLSGDIDRSYRMLVRQWLDSMEHLSEQYPYLYSLAARTSPLARAAAVVPAVGA